MERVKLFVCGGDFLEVFVEAVRVGDSHLVDGLFPSGDFPAFDKAASWGGNSPAFLGSLS